jgi:hypothetical protein
MQWLSYQLSDRATAVYLLVSLVLFALVLAWAWISDELARSRSDALVERIRAYLR